MKLKEAMISGFVGIEKVKIDLSGQITLVSGPNASGKSSVHDALCLVFSGQTNRQASSKNLTPLVGSGYAMAHIEVSQTNTDTCFVSTIGRDGVKTHNIVSKIGKYVFADRLVEMKFKDQTKAISSLLDLGVKADKVKAFFKKRNIKPSLYETTIDLATVDGALDFKRALLLVKDKGVSFKGEWRGITGQNYGTKIGATWQPKDKPSTTNRSDQIEAEIIQKEKVLLNIEKNISDYKSENSSDVAGFIFKCPACGDYLSMLNNDVKIHNNIEKRTGPTDQERSKYNFYVGLAATTKDDITKLRGQAIESNRPEGDGDKKYKRAAEVHENIMQLIEIANALGPDGIQGKVTGQGMSNVIELIEQSCTKLALNKPVTFTDLGFFVGKTPYAFASESEKWFARAVFSQAIQKIFDTDLLMLDHFDIVEPGKRQHVIKWLLDSGIKNVVVFGTSNTDLTDKFAAKKNVSYNWLG